MHVQNWCIANLKLLMFAILIAIVLRSLLQALQPRYLYHSSPGEQGGWSHLLDNTALDKENG